MEKKTQIIYYSKVRHTYIKFITINNWETQFTFAFNNDLYFLMFDHQDIKKRKYKTIYARHILHSASIGYKPKCTKTQSVDN